MKKFNITLLIILLAAVAIRLGGVLYHQPFMHNHDEINYIETALRFGKLNFEPFTFSHAYLLPVMLFFEYVIFFLVKKTIHFGLRPENFIAYYVENPDIFLYIGRVMIFLFSIGVVYLIYRISKDLFDRRVAVLSGFISAFTFGLVQLTCSIKADIPAIFLLLLSFLLATKAIRAHSKRHLFWAFFIMGLAAATKYHVILGLSFLIATTLLYFREKYEWLKILLCGALLTLFGFIVGCPFILIKPVSIFRDTIVRMGREYILYKTISFPIAFHLKYHLRNLLGIPLELLAIVAFFYSIFRHRKEDIILLSFVVTFFAFFFNSIGFAYHLLPAVPLLIMMSARLLADTANRLTKSRTRQNIILICLTGLIIYPTFIDSLKYNIYLNSRDTRTLSKEWVEDNIKPNEDILIEGAIAKVDISVICSLEPNIESMQADLAFIKDQGGTGYLVQKRIELLKDRGNKERKITYGIKKVDFITTDVINRLNPAYVMINGYNDVDLGELAYYFPDDLKEKVEKAKRHLRSSYKLIKRFSPTIKTSAYSTIFTNNDYMALRSIGLKDAMHMIKGPELSLYKRAN